MEIDDTVRVMGRETRMPLRCMGVLRVAEVHEVRASLTLYGERFDVERVGLVPGDRVRTGDVVARLVAPLAEIREVRQGATVHLMQAQLADAQRDAHKNRDAVAVDLAVAAAAHRLGQERAMMEFFQRLRAGEEVRSPIDGVVVDLPPLTDDGWSSVVVARVARTDPLTLGVAVPFGAGVPVPGAACEVIVGGLSRAATVRGVAPCADADGNVVLMFDIANTDRALVGGLRAETVIDVGVRQSMFVPSSALVRVGDEFSVWIVAPGGVERRSVKVVSGSPDDPEVEISGVVAAELVVRDAVRYLAGATRQARGQGHDSVGADDGDVDADGEDVADFDGSDNGIISDERCFPQW